MNDAQPDIEVGYILHKQFWNKGYATELATSFLAWGFQHLTVDKLIATVHPDNTAFLVQTSCESYPFSNRLQGRVSIYAASNSICTCCPRAAAIFTKASKENREMRPRSISFMRG